MAGIAGYVFNDQFMRAASAAMGAAGNTTGEHVVNGAYQFCTETTRSFVNEHFLRAMTTPIYTAGNASIEYISEASSEYITELTSRIASTIVRSAMNEGGATLQEANFSEVAQNISQFIAREAPEFIKKLNMTSISEVFGKEFSEALIKYVQSMDLKSIVSTVIKEVNDAALTAGKELNLNETAKIYGEKLQRFLLDAGMPLSDALSQISANFSQGILMHSVPYLLLGVGLILGTGCSVIYLYRRMSYNIGRPPLAQRIRQNGGFFSWIWKLNPSYLFRSKKEQLPKIKPVFNEPISKRLKVIKSGLANTLKRGGFFQNVLLYGDGGTGKTMVAEQIIEESGMNSIEMSGGDLCQYNARGEGVTEFNRLFNSISAPTIVFTDEFECIARRRDTLGMSQALLEIENRLLNALGSPNRKVCFMASTNRLQDIDPAMLTRFDHILHISPPELPERRKILLQNIEANFNSEEIALYFNDRTLNEIAQYTQGFTGRKLQKLVNEILMRKECSDDHELSEELIVEAVRDIVEQERTVRDISDRGSSISLGDEQVEIMVAETPPAKVPKSSANTVRDISDRGSSISLGDKQTEIMAAETPPAKQLESSAN